MKTKTAHPVSPVPTKTIQPAPPNAEARKARCFDPDWKYSREESTDIRKTFARIRRQLKESEAAKPPANIKTIHPERIKGAK